MESIFNLLIEAPKAPKEFVFFMNKHNITVRYNFKNNNQIEYVHLKHNVTSKYIVAKIDQNRVPTLLFTGRSFISKPNNIPATSKESRRFKPMVIGNVQGLYYDDGKWSICNNQAFNCNNLKWNCDIPLQDIINNILTRDKLFEVLDPKLCYTIIYSSHHNNIFLSKPEDDYIFFLDAYHIEGNKIFETCSLETYALPIIPYIDGEKTIAELNEILSTSEIDRQLSNSTPSGTQYYGIIEETPDEFRIHMTDLGKSIISLLFNKALPSVRNSQYRDYILLCAICSLGKEEDIIRTFAPHNKERLDRLNKLITDIAENLQSYNTDTIVNHAGDPIVRLFLDKFSDQLNLNSITDTVTVRDFLCHPDFIPLFLNEIKVLTQTEST